MTRPKLQPLRVPRGQQDQPSPAASPYSGAPGANAAENNWGAKATDSTPSWVISIREFAEGLARAAPVVTAPMPLCAGAMFDAGESGGCGWEDQAQEETMVATSPCLENDLETLVGSLEIEGSALPSWPEVVPAARLALARSLISGDVSSEKASAFPPAVSISGVNSDAGTVHIRFEVVPSGPGEVATLAARLREEAAQRGAARLLPMFISLLEEQGYSVGGSCRVRLRVGSTARPGATTPPSPTAANLAKNPELRARVVPFALPLDALRSGNASAFGTPGDKKGLASPRRLRRVEGL